MAVDDDLGDAPPADIIPFPNMRANRAVADAWEAEVAARNRTQQTKYRFPSPLGVLDELMRKRAMPAFPWPASWPDLGRRARCHPGDSVAVIGPPGGGKTSFAIQACRSAMGDGIPALWCALELDETQIATRLVANAHGVHSILIRENWSRDRIAHSLAAFDDLWRFVDRCSDPDVQINAAREAIALAKRVYRVPPVLVIDYLGKLASTSRDIRLATIHAAEQLRALGVAEECYVFMLAQPSRSSSALLTGRSEIESATDAIGVAGDSSEVENACRVVLGLNVFKADDATELDAHVLVTKSNTGLEGRVGFRFGKPGGVWSELDFLPATPGEVKAAVTKAKADKHRATPAPTPVEARVDLNLTKAHDADGDRKRLLLSAISKAGAAGLLIDGARLGGMRASLARKLLAEMQKQKIVEPMEGNRWRITGPKEKP